jgi:hypothetical protein
MSLQSATARLLLLVLLPVSYGCETNVNGPTVVAEDEVVGSYQATTLTALVAGSTTDQLALGTRIEIELRPDMRTDGRLFAPEAGDDGKDVDQRLRGTWSFDPETQAVTFNHSAQTFLRDMTFQAQRQGKNVQLRAENSYGIMRIKAVLSQR